MGLAAAKTVTYTVENRDFNRVSLNVLGRFMLADHTEHNCTVYQMSPGDVSVQCKRSGNVGERVILYIDHIGRVDGKIARVFSGGFAVDFKASRQKQDRLAAKLTWLANRHELSLPEDRRHDRIVPHNPVVNVTLEDLRVYKGRISDMSLSGCALDMDVRPAIGTRALIGKMSAQVVRHSHEGIAAEFSNVQRRDTLEMFLHS